MMSTTVDVSAFRLRPGGLPAAQVLADTTDSGRTVSSLSKLVQRVVFQLMTRAGSVPNFPIVGCEFIDRLLTGRVSTETDVFLALAASLGTVTRNVKAEQQTTDPDDERLASISIIGLSLSKGQAAVRLRVRNVAGVAMAVTLPLSFGL